MSAATFNLTGTRIIEQNAQFLLTFTYPGNVATANLKGQIRKIPGGDLLADFRLGTVTYDQQTDKTTFTIGLDSRQTDKIPIPPEGGHWVYDVRMRPQGGDNIRLFQGTVEVSPNVTEN